MEQVNHLYHPIDSLCMRIGMPLADVFSGLMITLVFALLYNGIPGKGVRKGLNFGLMLWLIHGLAGELFWWTMSPIPFMLLVAGWLHSLVLCSLGGMAIAGIYGKSLEVNLASYPKGRGFWENFLIILFHLPINSKAL